MELMLLVVLKGRPPRRWRAAALPEDDMELQENGTTLINVRRSKTALQAEGVILYISQRPGEALRAIKPAEELLDRSTPAFELSPRKIGERVNAAARAADLGKGFTAYSGRMGRAQDLANSGAELPTLRRPPVGARALQCLPGTRNGRRQTGVLWLGTTIDEVSRGNRELVIALQQSRELGFTQWAATVSNVVYSRVTEEETSKVWLNVSRFRIAYDGSRPGTVSGCPASIVQCLPW